MELGFIAYIPTLNDLLNSPNVREGMVVITLGENEINDGKGKLYLIVNKLNSSKYTKSGQSCISNPSLMLVDLKLRSDNENINKMEEQLSAFKSLIDTIIMNN